jgi:hypothetical protein
MCATCTLFAAPRSCKVVEGDISPNGWCKSYAMADYESQQDQPFAG